MLTQFLVEFMQAQYTEILHHLDRIVTQVEGLSERVGRLERTQLFNFSTFANMDTKPLFRSKEFWVAALGFIFFVLQGLTTVTIPPGTADEIVALDWSNVGGALLSLAIIILRAFFTKTKIVGIA